VISRIAKTSTVSDVVRTARANGFRVDFAGHDADTCEVFDGKVQVYWALRKTDAHDAWIVRYHPDYFERENNV
jgi:hypothetical protein